MSRYDRLVFLSVFVALCACGGGTAGSVATFPQTGPDTHTPSNSTRSVQLGYAPITVTLPIISQISGSVSFPATSAPAIIDLSALVGLAQDIAAQKSRRTQAATLTVYESIAMTPRTTISLPQIPAMNFTYPASIPLALKTFFYGISDVDPQGGQVSFNTQGPGAINGQTVFFAHVPTPIILEAGHTYRFIVYATTSAAAPASKIYVANGATNTITTYKSDGTRTTPTITSGVSAPGEVVVDSAGKIYVLNYGTDTLTTYNADGTQTTPTIATASGSQLTLAVGPHGEIYIGSGFVVNTFNADGSPTPYPSGVGVEFDPASIAVDASSKLYVLDSNSNPYVPGNTLFTFNASGIATTPTVTAGVAVPQSVAVDAAGKIYVVNEHIANDNTSVSDITTYRSDGSQTLPTISAGLNAPQSIAVDASGKIYVLNTGNNTIVTYNADGTQTTPTITGLASASGIAVR